MEDKKTLSESPPSSQQVFVLAPTPVQLGRCKRASADYRADFQRSAIQPFKTSYVLDPPVISIPDPEDHSSPSNKMPAPSSAMEPPLLSPRKPILKKTLEDRVLEDVEFSKRFARLPEFNPEDCQSPSALTLSHSPRTFVQSYRKKRRTSTVLDEGAEQDTASAKTRCYSSSSECGTPKSAKFEGNKFFGEDFSLEVVSDVASSRIDGSDGEINSPRSPRTPKTPREGGGDKSYSSLRRTLDCRRQLVMQLFQEHGFFPSGQATSSFQSKHTDIFPSKMCLQLKIREVRQKLMAHGNVMAVTNTGASISTPTVTFSTAIIQPTTPIPTTTTSVSTISLSSSASLPTFGTNSKNSNGGEQDNNNNRQSKLDCGNDGRVNSKQHQPLTPPPSAQDNPSSSSTTSKLREL